MIESDSEQTAQSPTVKRKHKFGDVREDGYRFRAFNKTTRCEIWCSPEAFCRFVERKNALQKAHPERHRLYRRRWKARNPDTIKRWKKAGAKRRNAKLKWPSGPERMVIKTIYAMCSRVSACTDIPHHVDHIISVANGGPHRATNLRVIPAVVNMMKGARGI